MTMTMTITKLIQKTLLAGAALTLGLTAQAAEPESCKVVNFATVGWADITATTAAASVVLEALGYEPKTHLSSVTIAYVGLQKKNDDVFLGNWMPAQESAIAPFLKEGSVEVVRTNLEGAKFTLAAPRYVVEGGLKDFADIARFKDKLGGKIYGIESGSDGNRHIQDAIRDLGMQGIKLVPSSEAGMLTQLKRAIQRKQWVVFLGWEPHPMNSNFDIAYLSSGDRWFGPDFGGATVRTVVRKGYLEQCPNVGRFLKNLEFSLRMENEIMSAMDQGTPETQAAADWLARHPEVAKNWLTGVTTLDGGDAAAALNARLQRR